MVKLSQKRSADCPTGMKAPIRSLRAAAKQVFQEALRSVCADKAIRDVLSTEKTSRGESLRCGRRRFPLHPRGRIIVVGAGKASAHMARETERVLGRRISIGAVVTQEGYGADCKRVEIFEASHPLPDANGLKAARHIGKLVDGASKDDLVLCLLSGGGSALLPSPATGISISDKQSITDLMLKSGAPIQALNCVRKHLSSLKGGHLARRAAPARVITMVISDVVGDSLDTIASGPTIGDPTTFTEARALLEHFGIWQRAPVSIKRRISDGTQGRISETPAPNNPIFNSVFHLIVANNRVALEAASQKARSLGFRPLVLTRRLQGEAREIGAFLAGLAREIKVEKRPIRPPACILLGGEATVTVRGKGLGGRCQELATAFAAHGGASRGICLLAGGSDGKDGPTPVAGGIVDEKTGELIQKQGIDPRSFLRENCSHEFIGRFGELLSTGPTKTNVMDIIVVNVC